MIIFSEKIALSPGTVPLKVKPHGAWNRGEMGEHKDSKGICIGFEKIALSPGTVPLKVKPHGAWNRGEMGEHKDSKGICIGFVKRG